MPWLSALAQIPSRGLWLDCQGFNDELRFRFSAVRFMAHCGDLQFNRFRVYFNSAVYLLHYLGFYGH